MKYPLKLIEWEDAYSGNHSWTRLEPDEKWDDTPMIVTTVGFVIDENEDRIKVAGSCSQHPEGPTSVCDLFTIPRGMIRREKTLRGRF